MLRSPTPEAKVIFELSDPTIRNAFILKNTGNILTMHFVGREQKFKIWDMKSSDPIFTHTINGDDHKLSAQCLTPHGPIL